MSKKGVVYLIGAGPGDAGLITVKGLQLISKVDVVVYDYLVNKRLLIHAKPEAEKIYVGKKSSTAPGHQKYINSLLVELSSDGKTIARLKGGDPVVFGRGGEEAKALSEHGIPFEIVPGVSAATAVPAYAGIPISHRDFTSEFAVVTGHENRNKDQSDVAWDALAKIRTIVILMGFKNLALNMERLIENGKDPDTPAALISWGTVSKQRTVVGTVSTLPKIVEDSGVKPPSIVVVGQVVSLREHINWYETKPLFGKKIVVTRSRSQASALVELIEEQGGETIEFPTIDIVPPSSFEDMDGAINDLSSYDWLVFTSVNGVERFFMRLFELGCDNRALGSIKIGAIGEQTANAVNIRGFNPDLVPSDFRAEGLIEALGNEGIDGKRILIPRAKEAREILPEELRKLGAEVDVVAAYETKRPHSDMSGEIKDMISSGNIDAVTFASSSTARNFFEALDISGEEGRTVMEKTAIACIGPVTAATVEKLGYEPRIVCSRYTIADLVSELCRYFGGE